jgi:hypothetical protein
VTLGRLAFEGAFLAGLAVAAVFIACMPSYIALNTSPPGRAQIDPQHIVAACLLLASWRLGLFARKQFASVRPALVFAPAAVATLWVMINVVGTVNGAIPRSRNFAEQWDAWDAGIRAWEPRETDRAFAPLLAVDGNVPNGFILIDTRDHDWMNVCVARYYGVNRIEGQPWLLKPVVVPDPRLLNPTPQPAA